jgi:hypothetical protein
MSACYSRHPYYDNYGGVSFAVGVDYGPYWYPGNYGTYNYIRYPWWGDPPPPPANDPMVEKNATHRAIVDQVKQSFNDKGYTEEQQGD